MSQPEFIAPHCSAELVILHRDEHVLILEKPSGLLSVPGQNPLNADSVLLRLKQSFPQARLVHRLDFGTSGLMIACLSDAAIAQLNRQFQLHQVAKQYTALLAGHLALEQGLIDLAIARDDFPRQKICAQTGKQAQSAYRVMAREYTRSGVAATRVEFKPQTGRTHQLRLHSQAIGYPIIGCDLYNAQLIIDGLSVDSQLLAERLLLHASALCFAHPASGEQLEFNSACPF